MFHFPASTPTQTMYSPAGNTTQLMLGFPIRTSSDQRFVGNSPRHNAASHVLHRLSMPRHPPYARNKTHGHTNNQGTNTKTQKRKILASTIQFSHNTTPTHNQPQPRGRFTQGPNRNNNVLPQTPNSAPTHIKPFVTQQCIHQPQHHAAQPHSASHTTIQTVQPKTDRCVSTRQFQHVAAAHSATSTTQTWPTTAGTQKQKLLRKEVIQPHLPVRLPCYDFVPIANPTFDGSLTSLGHRLRVLPTFMT